MSSCEFWQVFKNNSFTEQLWRWKDASIFVVFVTLTRPNFAFDSFGISISLTVEKSYNSLRSSFISKFFRPKLALCSNNRDSLTLWYDINSRVRFFISPIFHISRWKYEDYLPEFLDPKFQLMLFFPRKIHWRLLNLFRMSSLLILVFLRQFLFH